MWKTKNVGFLMLDLDADGVAVYHPLSDTDLERWRPSPERIWQFVAVSEREWQLYHCGQRLGTATRIRGTNDWQANSQAGDACIAPLHSPLECARCLAQRQSLEQFECARAD